MMLTLVVPLAAFSKGGPPDGKGGGGGKNSGTTVGTPDRVDYGDIFGDLIHIYRHEETGQPIYAQRWVELPADPDLQMDNGERGYGWGYCAIVYTDVVLDVDGNPTQIPFAPYSCDLDTAALADDLADLAAGEAAILAAELDTDDLTDDEFAELVAGLTVELAAELAADLIVEVDYFGRLNGARTRENNLRMHFDEVISNINQAVALKLGPVGRLMLEFCETWEYDLNFEKVCTSYAWSTIDSPMESLGLFTRLNRYGHFATDPLEEDLFWHGDPALYDEAVPSYPTHPALTVEDFQKFADAGLLHLLPDGIDCEYIGEDPDGHFECAALEAEDFGPEALEPEDFDSSAVYLGAAASKTGWVTVDLLQYLNRFLRISVATVDPNEGDVPPSSYAPVNSLPALYEDCWSSDQVPEYMGPEDEDDPLPTEDLDYDLSCKECNADGTAGDDASCPSAPPVNADLYVKMKERFMDFEKSAYTRGTRPNVDNAEASLIMPFTLHSVGLPTFLDGKFSAPQTVDLLDWIDIPNPLVWIDDDPNDPDDVADYDYGSNIRNYVIGANDAARSIEFIHNFEVPDDLYCKYLDADHPLFAIVECPPVE